MPTYFPAELQVNQLTGPHPNAEQTTDPIATTVQESTSPATSAVHSHHNIDSCTSVGAADRSERRAPIDMPLRPYSEDVQTAIDGILYIAQRLKDEEEENKIIQDWQWIAMVLDRFFLCLFTFICVLGSAVILLRAPSLYDQTLPIDHLLSNIGH